MPPISRVRTVFTGVAGTPWYSNLYFSSPGGSASVTAAVNAVHTFWFTMKGAIQTGVTWTVQGEVAQIENTTGELVGIINVPSLTNVGTAADEALPWATQALVQLNTNDFVHSRRVRGRIFVPAMGEANNTGGVPSSGLRSSLDGAAEALIADAGCILEVWSRPYAGSEGNPARQGSSHVVQSADVSPKWSVLRSRRD